MSEDTNSVKREIWESLGDKPSRDAFVAAHLSNNIGAQIFSMREAHGWSQGKLAEEVGMAQPRISVLEGGYDSYSLTTLKRLASAFDVAVVVRFVPFSELVEWVGDLSEERLTPVEFANDNLSFDDDRLSDEELEYSLVPVAQEEAWDNGANSGVVVWQQQEMTIHEARRQMINRHLSVNAQMETQTLPGLTTRLADLVHKVGIGNPLSQSPSGLMNAFIHHGETSAHGVSGRNTTASPGRLIWRGEPKESHARAERVTVASQRQRFPN